MKRYASVNQGDLSHHMRLCMWEVISMQSLTPCLALTPSSLMFVISMNEIGCVYAENLPLKQSGWLAKWLNIPSSTTNGREEDCVFIDATLTTSVNKPLTQLVAYISYRSRGHSNEILCLEDYKDTVRKRYVWLGQVSGPILGRSSHVIHIRSDGQKRGKATYTRTLCEA